MSEFIMSLNKYQIQALLKEMRINPEEDIMDAQISCHDDRIYAFHGKNSQGNFVKSIYTDFCIELIYNCVPSDYDQDRFQNTMIHILKECGLDKAYKKKAKLFNSEKRNHHEKEYSVGKFFDDEDEEIEP